MTSNEDKLNNSYFIEATDPRVLIVEEMFNSKQFDVPRKLKVLSRRQLNNILIKTMLNMMVKDPERLHYRSTEFDMFQEFAKYIKSQLYSALK
jgi:hypothetical protein